jgi:hypothetical protein
VTNFSADDIHRSVRRYVALALGEDWTIRTEREVVKDSERPVAVVEWSTAIGRSPGHPPDRRTIPQGDVSRMGTMAVTAYPAIFDTAREGKHESELIAQLLDESIGQGLVKRDGSGPVVNVGHPLAIPVYDYAAVPVKGANRAGPPNPYGWAMVADHSVHPLQDPLDEKRWTVAVSIRLTWWRAGRQPPPGPRATRGVIGTGHLH